MTLYVCKWLHIVRTYPTLVLVRDRGLGGPRVLPLLLAFRLPPRLLATLVDPPRRVYTCVANCGREGRASITRVTIFL